MNEKYKATLITCLTITMLAISLVWLGAKQHSHTLENQIKTAEDGMQATITTMETFSFSPYRQRLKNMLQNRPDLAETFAAQDRTLFLQRALPVYAALQEENPFIKNMHFHLPDGRTFVRLHKPDFYGDDLTLIRPMIASVHRTHTPASGFEIGHSGPFFRIVEPVFLKGEYIGAAEIGILPSQILILLENQKDLTVTTYFTREAFDKTTLVDKGHLRLLDNLQILTQDRDIFTQLPDDITLSHPTQRLDIGRRSYILHSRPFFRDFKDQSIGGLLVLQDITTTMADQKAFLLQSTISSALLLLLTLGFVSFYFNRVMGALLREIAERKKSEQALKNALEKQSIMETQLHRALKMEAIGLMAGGVAHELNNILSGIISYPELLLMELPEESAMCEPLKAIKESGIRAAAVVSDMLTVARGVAKTTEVADPQQFINTYLESPEYLELCRRYPHIKIITQLEAGPKFIRCSTVHIMKVLTNLINNAGEAIHDKGTITIRTSMVELNDPVAMEHDIESGPYYLLAICDDGPGIAAADLPHIFEPFFTKKSMGRSGTGLGLSVVWNAMRDHGGTVLAESSAKGSCFKLFFPVCDAECSPAAESELPMVVAGNGETILIVDDDLQQRLIAEKILETLGYQPCTASSGEEAVEYLGHHQVDLVILDMIMEPGMNGRETYARIRQLHPEQKAIIASGFSQSVEVEATLGMGAGQYIKKPYTIDQLAAAIKRELHKKEKS